MEFGFIVLLIVAAVIVIGVFWGLSERRVRSTPLSIDPVDTRHLMSHWQTPTKQSERPPSTTSKPASMISKPVRPHIPGTDRYGSTKTTRAYDNYYNRSNQDNSG